MLSYTTLQNLIQIARMIIDITIITLIIYYCLKLVRNNSRTIQIFKGIIFVLVAKGLATLLGLGTTQVIADTVVQWGFLAVIIVFQPEIRSLLERLGKSNVFNRISSLSGNEREKLVDELVIASMSMAEQRVGALISIEQTQSLNDYIKTGTPMNSIVTADLLTSIFVTTTPLHDGAVIIQGDKIACAAAYFLPTDRNLPRRFGARHRAAVGISEITDAITIVVSEETGNVSIAQNGELTKMSEVSLRQFLLKTICHEEVEHGDRGLIKKEINRDEDEEMIQSILAEKKLIVEKEEKGEEVKPVSKSLSIFKKKEKKTAEPKPEEPVKKEEPAKKEEPVVDKKEEPVTETKEETSKPKKRPKVKLEFSASDDAMMDMEDWDITSQNEKGGESNE